MSSLINTATLVLNPPAQRRSWQKETPSPASHIAGGAGLKVWHLMHRLYGLLANTSAHLETEDSSDEITRPMSAAQARPHLGARTGRIMVVEDEGIVALDIKMTLKRMGHNLDFARSSSIAQGRDKGIE